MAVDIGGVRTNFRMPDTLSIGLGGGSLVEANPLKVGPQSVGYELITKAKGFWRRYLNHNRYHRGSRS